jgi:hypothetical protein
MKNRLGRGTIALLALATLGLGLLPHAARAGRPAADAQYFALLPVTMRDASLATGGDFPRPPTSLPLTREPSTTPSPTSVTPSLTPSATSEPDTATPSPTSVPAETPTELPATGRIHGRYTESGQPLAAGYGDVGLPQIELHRCLSRDCVKVANTIAQEGGVAEFVNPPALGSGQYYQIVWVNDQGLGYDGHLYRWWSRKVTSAEFGAGQDVDVGVMEVANLELTNPCHDCLQTLPITFKWNPRSNAAEVYRWSLFKQCGHDEYRVNAYQTQALGHAKEYVVSSPPPEYRYDEKYCWFIHIDDGRNGSGWTYYAHRVTFCSSPETCR